MKLPYFSIPEHQASKDFPFEAFHKTYFLQIQDSAKRVIRMWVSGNVGLYLFCRDGGRELMSVSDNMVMEVVSAAVSGREVAGNWMRIVYTESASPLQSAKNN